MMEILNGTQISYRVDITMNIESEVCDLHCDSQLNQRFDSCIQQPEFNIVDTFHSPASEDFALIADKVPSAWFAIGAAVDLPETVTACIIQRQLFMKMRCLMVLSSMHAVRWTIWIPTFVEIT